MMKTKLNAGQRQAMEASEGRVRVVAGAGSGKTRVLAHRYAFLVNDLGISPGNILCLTFTNKAAQEMKSRISKMVDRGSVNDFICTIHSFCVKFLRREIYRIGYPKNFTVMDEADSIILAKQAMDEFGIDRKKLTAERFLTQVAQLKAYSIDAYIQRHLLPASSPDCPDANIRYLRLQLKHYVLDYDDLIYFTIYILNHFSEARKYWTDKLNYIMIDEAQDCSIDDWNLIEILAERHHNLFVVGDPDQAIYEWRGARPSKFVNFSCDTDIILNQNYRSTPDILDVANSIIAHNRNRVPKDLFSMRLNERRTVYRHEKSEADEAQHVADTIGNAVASGEKPGDFAVLYRSAFLSRRVEQELLKRKIPYAVWGGVRFFERKEIRDVICYLRLIASDDDDMAFSRIINLPSRKFGAASMKALATLAQEKEVPLFVALKMAVGDRRFDRPTLHRFIDMIESARMWSRQMPVSELTDRILVESKLADLYRLDEQEERLENLSELINQMKEFEQSQIDDGDMTLASYLQEIALYTDADTFSDASRVRLMTIHQSKGLEFPTVFVVGLTEGVFPSHRSIRERRLDGEEEERRLMYVAVTRAASMLYLSESEGYLNGNGALKYPSRFIAEIPDELLTVEGNPDPALFEGTRDMVALLEQELGEGDHAPMSVGTEVEHKVFGRGIIVRFDSASQSYRVRFGDNERDLVARVLRQL